MPDRREGFPIGSLVRGTTYTRPALRVIAGLPPKGGDFDTGYARVGDEWVIFANLGGSRTGHHYANRWIPDGFEWFGKTNSKPSDKAIVEMTSGVTVHLFTREADRDPWRYHGTVTPVRGPEGERPVRMVWAIRDRIDGGRENGVEVAGPAYLLAWHPDRWSFPDYSGYAIAVHDGVAEPIPWSIGNRQVLPAGSRLYLNRVGREPRGIIGSGVAVGSVHGEPHWDASRAMRGETLPRVSVEFDHLLDVGHAVPFDPRTSGAAALARFDWSSRAGGIAVPRDVAQVLEREWQRHVQRQQVSRPRSVPVPLEDPSTVVARRGETGSVVRPAIIGVAGSSGGAAAGEVRRTTAAKAVGDRAEWIVKQHLESRLPAELRSTIRHHAAAGETPGYDLSYGPPDSFIAVEVKGSVQATISSIELTANEWRAAQELGDRYHLYVVGNASSNRPVIEVITHAASRLVVEPAVYRARVVQA